MIYARHKTGRIGTKCFHDPKYEGQTAVIHGQKRWSGCVSGEMARGDVLVVETMDGMLHVWHRDCMELFP